jgi:cystathionine gamma-synthase
MKFNTVCLHAAKDMTHSTGAVAAPIYQSATFARESVDSNQTYSYSRLQNPTREHLENIMARLEEGAGAVAFSTGMAAEAAVMELFSQGDRVIASDDLYGGSIRLFNNFSKKNGIIVDYVDTGDIGAIKKLIAPTTKAVFVETPTNPMLKVTDIAEVSKLAREHGLLLIVDNTFLTPYFQLPIRLGADIVIHSGTKYLCGHNDTMAGVAVAASADMAEKLHYINKTTGAPLSPFDCFLMTRGIKTLAVRMERHNQNASEAAKWLCRQKKVKKVYYLGLESHPGHETVKKQSTGFGGMISFEVESAELALSVLKKVKVIQFAESLGGVESLITYPVTQTHADVPAEKREKNGINERLLRLSVGIEDVCDIIADLDQAIN